MPQAFPYLVQRMMAVLEVSAEHTITNSVEIFFGKFGSSKTCIRLYRNLESKP